ncbi:MAG: hypothetical protein AB7G15_16950 [Alphaproteobacteria bacterium]
MNDIWCEYCKRFFSAGWHSCVHYGGDGTQHPRKRNEADFNDGHKAGFNVALEQVAKWHDEEQVKAFELADMEDDYRGQNNLRGETHEAAAAHVRSMKKP